jgi:hypothetical protein
MECKRMVGNADAVRSSISYRKRAVVIHFQCTCDQLQNGTKHVRKAASPVSHLTSRSRGQELSVTWRAVATYNVDKLSNGAFSRVYKHGTSDKIAGFRQSQGQQLNIQPVAVSAVPLAGARELAEQWRSTTK